jgi:hypothetical protein
MWKEAYKKDENEATSRNISTSPRCGNEVKARIARGGI